jgi:lipopolysaccharide export system protein LptA
VRKYVLTLLLLTAVSAVMAQKKSVINLIRSKSIQGVKINGVDVLKVYGGTFQQDYSTLSSDSAYFHQAQNTFDAFGNVVITQGDTLHIYSDKLNYNGNTKIAILTQNVRMVDKDATLSTDFLTYNTATKVGTYTGGGKLVNKDNTLTSKNGYYFANSRDSYFRYDVVLLSPDAITKTDTLRYNSGSKIAYFYGPTHIYGKKSGKDNDTLYTENGNYNTVTEQAFFGKKNLYSAGSKTLKGDSMFYDRKQGYGRVVNHITFNDNEQKMTLKGDLGTYYKSDERTVVTQNAYGIIVTEEKDTTKNDSLAAKPAIKPTGSKKAAADSAKTAPPAKAASGKAGKPDNKPAAPPITIPVKQLPGPKQDTAAGRKGDKAAAKNKLNDSAQLKKDTARIKHDSVYMTADTLETRMLTYKELKDLKEKIRLANIKDTTLRAPSIVYKKPLTYIELSAPGWVQDSTFLHRNMFGNAPPKKDTTGKITGKTQKPDKTTQAAAAKKLSTQDSLKQTRKVDSVYLSRKIELSDTSRIRILSAFHHVKLFKSDLQGKSDSAFYSTSDSIIRLYVKPMLWAQNSQLSGDTINLQLKNKKFDNVELFLNAFAVNIEKGDSIHFNQSAGKKMRGFFHSDKLERLFIDGNAETIYFSRDSGKISGMQRSLSSRIKINFKDGKVGTLVFLAKPEHRYGPLAKFSEEDKILKGFIWKPKDRPVSKEAIIPSLAGGGVATANAGSKGQPPARGKSTKKIPGGKTAAAGAAGVKPAGNPVAPVKLRGDSTAKALKDTTAGPAPKKSDTTRSKKDSTAAVKPG